MRRPRRFLPSVSQLVAFEAVLRTRSTTAAALDLDLTQSTVSRLVLSLEEQLGRHLFTRHHKRLTPTEAGIRYGAEITRALNIIQQASTSLAINPSGGVLSLATLPTVGTRWLAPRIGTFLAVHPGVLLNFATRIPRFSFDVEPFDAVIFFGEPDWPGAIHQKMFDEALLACTAPDTLQQSPINDVEDLEGWLLLHLESRPHAWAQWFTAQGAEGPPGNGMLMDQYPVMIQAAAQGLGIALLPEYLALSEIAEERLVALPFRPVHGVGAYWLAWPEAKDGYEPLVKFRDWIGQQVGS